MINKYPKILSISHYIYLTREQRYAVFSEEQVETVGVSVPVWFKGGNTSEPAKEVFCRYIISNDRSVNGVELFDEGYLINLKVFDPDVRLQSLLDFKDRGHEEIVSKGYAKLVNDGKLLKAFHCIEIKPVELLLATLS